MQRTVLVYNLNSKGLFICHSIKILVCTNNKCWECTVMCALFDISISMEVTGNHYIDTLILATMRKVLPSVTTTVPRVLVKRNVRNDDSIGSGFELLALQYMDTLFILEKMARFLK